jgi:hypothetical protein
MNVIEHYDRKNIHIGNAIEIDEDTHYCKLSYNEMPFIIKTNKVCFLKKRARYSSEYVNISISSKDYLEWFEQFYQDCIELFHERSIDWFEEEMTLSDIEFSFINPLKSNIRNNCFDVACAIDENRLHVVDTNDKIMNLNSLEDSNVIPTFHIKGIKFNTKHFMLEIELNNLCVLTDSSELTEGHVKETVQSKLTLAETSVDEESKTVESIESLKLETPESPNEIQDENQLDEVDIDVEHLEEMDIELEELGVYKAFEMVNKRIKENMIEHLRTIFDQKKIKINNLDLVEMIDDEDE